MQRRRFMFPAVPPMPRQLQPPRSCKDHRKSSRHLRNSNGERTGELFGGSRQGNTFDPDVFAKRSSSETQVSKESVGWDQLFHEGTSAGELVDVLDRQDANSSGRS
ncbi:hypothetical protein CUJ84_Chr002062 [Rhizobium leguminosarum]|uniref:Uncharacterized protein n=1 Tax=Rhizobium leguminosarum TaxID=384 RepID=A0A2K9Z2G7_RHILE|nr:hypothetical protein CUJ84_Chr002062 [Rhizobium leguminosarum]